MNAVLLPLHAPAPNGEAVVLSVHGTFSDDTADSGARWWQSGSDFAKRLTRTLPEGVRLAQDDEVFHWSGDNSERARNKAAAELLEQLDAYELAGRSYHLVGHSHGGSVIWHALKRAALRNHALPGLRSWTTIGTPFLQHRSRGAFSPSNVLAVLLTLVLLKPFLSYAWVLYGTFKQAFLGGTPTLVLPSDERLRLYALLRAPLLSLVELLGVPVDRRPEGVYFGSYDPAGTQPFADYLFHSYEGLVLLGVTALSAYFFLMLAMVCFVPVFESHRIRAEARLDRRAYAVYGPRWLGVWSRDDEAINGLRATIDLSLRFVGRLMPRDIVFVSDAPSLLFRPILWCVAPFYNHLLRPILDGYVRGIVVRSAQGNDRPTAMLIDVTATPIACSQGDFRPLPTQFNEKLVGFSDARARDIAPKLRRLLGQPSFSLGLEAFAEELSGQELVHTSYFEHEEVAALVTRNMAFGEGGFAAVGGGRLPLALLTWFVQSKEESLRYCPSRPGWVDAPAEQAPEARPARRAA